MKFISYQSNLLSVRGRLLSGLLARSRSESRPIHRPLTRSASFSPKYDEDAEPAQVHLADGTVFEGWSFGHPKSMSGEVVFNTGMVGYPESLSDPSYRGQILTMTYPLVGNYGVPSAARDIYDLPAHFESDEMQVRGLIVSEYSHEYSHWNATRSLGEWLRESKVPAVYGIDTRALTKHIRDKGSMLGKIVIGADVCDAPLYDPNKEHLVDQVTCRESKTYGKGQSNVKVLAVDCGMKHSIIRALVAKGAEVTVVPWDHDIVADMDNYDALFLSNGPGDPTMCQVTIDNLKELIARPHPKPIFGICLGHQLLALAAGATAFKLKYGHRGHNQPCIDLLDNRCYITSQNHGFAVDTSSLLEGWAPAFVNANDQTSEGIMHTMKPFFSVQFHPEARGGPLDTDFLFDRFLQLIKHNMEIESKAEQTSTGTSVGRMLASGKSLYECMGTYEVPPLSVIAPATAQRVRQNPPKKVLILGSGGLQIGQAGEFDYSGSQAIKALKEDNIQTVLINPNIATVQTKTGLADKVYFLPVTVAFVTSVIEKEKPDGILLQFGGQTALNCGVELHDLGVLARNNVQVLGTSVETIVATEDRNEFAAKLTEIQEPIANSVACISIAEATYAAEQIGYPVICRAAFALGGLGSGFAHDPRELQELVRKALAASPQVLIEKSMKGWKEVEYEVVRDLDNNCITVCNMENFDPLGIHTGDSIVVAPSQTLDDYEYHMLRTAAIRIVRHLGVVGECNVQYALHPTSREYCVIEVNPRLSRSSALASKATGYPLAFVAAKLALGMSLPELRNSITHVTSACFEPSLDYIVTKIPRWDIRKFARVSPALGSSMKSVGEVMAIGRTFEESFQKALRMVDSSVQGFQPKPGMEDNFGWVLENPTDQRVFALAEALDQGWTAAQMHDATKIDFWFLNKLERLQRIKNQLKTGDLTFDVLRSAKTAGFSDKGIATHAGNTTELEVRALRKSMGIVPVTKQIDTLAAEWPAQTNYLYTTYNGSESDVTFGEGAKAIVALGGGCYCIGNSVEFDYTAVSCIRTLRELGEKTVMINYNPETVSTDYDESDRLYFEELSLERVLDITDQEQPKGVVVSVGGQIPNNLAVPLAKAGVPILGTPADMIDNAEDRMKFSQLCDDIGVDQPEWKELSTLDEAFAFADRVQYPVLVRPSYVLSGAAMKVVRCHEALEKFLLLAGDISGDHPVVISKFIDNAKEIEMDGVGREGEVVIFAVHEHIENAGVHSGDATLVLPPHDLSPEMRKKVYESGAKICKALNISGPFNAQFIVKGTEVKVIECNVRASRSFPFVSKILGIDFIEQAARIFAGVDVDPRVKQVDWSKLDFVGVKVPNFSFTRLGGADPVLGVEMASTGEVACYGNNRHEALLKAMLAANFKMPQKNILLLTGEDAHKEDFMSSAQTLVDMGFRLFGTPGTAAALVKHGIPVTHVYMDKEGAGDDEHMVDLSSISDKMDFKDHPLPVHEIIKQKGVDLVINFPMPHLSDAENHERYRVRRAAVDFSIPLINNLQVAKAFVTALDKTESFSLKGGGEFTHAV